MLFSEICPVPILEKNPQPSNFLTDVFPNLLGFTPWMFWMNPTILRFLCPNSLSHGYLTFSNEGKLQIAKAPIVWHGMI